MGATIVNADTDSNGTGDGRCLSMTNLTAASSISGFTFVKGVAPAATSLGGGIYMSACGATVAGCEVTDCAADIGGALYLTGSPATVTGSVIHHNTCTAFDLYSVIHCLNSGATFEGNTIAENDPGNLFNQNTVATPPLIVHNNILWNGFFSDLGGTNITSTYNTVAIGITAGTGNIDTDPLFADAVNDFHLQSAGGRWNGVI